MGVSEREREEEGPLGVYEKTGGGVSGTQFFVYRK